MSKKITIVYHKGKPTIESLKAIVAMLSEGFLQGIDNPVGINWEVMGDYDELLN